jgi:hypothetical protein
MVHSLTVLEAVIIMGFLLIRKRYANQVKKSRRFQNQKVIEPRFMAMYIKKINMILISRGIFAQFRHGHYHGHERGLKCKRSTS